MASMRSLVCIAAFMAICTSVASQTPSDAKLLEKTRAMYDAPFRRELIGFDCDIDFDWNAHFVDLLGTVPPAAAPLIGRLKTIHYKIAVDRNQATVSSMPAVPDLKSTEHATELEQGLRAVLTSGLNAWVPTATNVLLPVGPTTYNYEKLANGYKLSMKGPGVDGTLLLSADFRITSGVTNAPQPLRFTTEFIDGPHGYLLSHLQTSNTADVSTPLDASFRYTYQDVQGFRLPLEIEIVPAGPEKWRYTLSGCKLTTGVQIQNLPRN